MNKRKYTDKERVIRNRQHQKKYVQKNREKRNKLQRDYYKRHPEKVKAHRRDRDKRGNHCEKCCSTHDLEFHHTDYLNGIGITLCMVCHKKEHGRYNGD